MVYKEKRLFMTIKVRIFFLFIQDIYYYNYKELLKKKLIAMF